MATYHSTRSKAPALTSKEAIRRGIAPDGGLYVSDALGDAIVDFENLADKDYFELAREVLGPCCPTTPPTKSQPASPRRMRARLRVTSWRP